jgi:hypothetical protein
VHAGVASVEKLSRVNGLLPMPRASKAPGRGPQEAKRNAGLRAPDVRFAPSGLPAAGATLPKATAEGLLALEPIH